MSKMKTKDEVQEKYDELVKIRNEMNLDNSAITSMLEIGHEVFALAWVLGMRIDLPYDTSKQTMTKEQLEASIVKNYSDRDGSKSYVKKS